MEAISDRRPLRLQFEFVNTFLILWDAILLYSYYCVCPVYFCGIVYGVGLLSFKGHVNVTDEVCMTSWISRRAGMIGMFAESFQ